MAKTKKRSTQQLAEILAPVMPRKTPEQTENCLKRFDEMCETFGIGERLWHDDVLRVLHTPVALVKGLWQDKKYRPKLETLLREYMSEER